MAKLKPFVRAVCANDINLPQEIKSLQPNKREELNELCFVLAKFFAVFNNIAMAAAAYNQKCYYVVKRVFEMS